MMPLHREAFVPPVTHSEYPLVRSIIFPRVPFLQAKYCIESNDDIGDSRILSTSCIETLSPNIIDGVAPRSRGALVIVGVRLPSSNTI